MSRRAEPHTDNIGGPPRPFLGKRKETTAKAMRQERRIEWCFIRVQAISSPPLKSWVNVSTAAEYC